MATSMTAQPSTVITYTLSESTVDTTVSESTTVSYTPVFANGTGSGQSNYGTFSTGYLPSGGILTKDVRSISKDILGNSLSLTFTKINSIVITAHWNEINSWGPSGTGTASTFPVEKLPYLTVSTTGANGFTNLLSDSKVGHDGAIQNINFTGEPSSATQKNIALIDSGSGISYQMIIVGVTG